MLVLGARFPLGRADTLEERLPLPDGMQGYLTSGRVVPVNVKYNLMPAQHLDSGAEMTPPGYLLFTLGALGDPRRQGLHLLSVSFRGVRWPACRMQQRVNESVTQACLTLWDTTDCSPSLLHPQ